MNAYAPGEGIAPHVDLPGRYDDGVVGVSLGSGCAMRFARARAGEQCGGREGRKKTEGREGSEESEGRGKREQIQEADDDDDDEACEVYLPVGSVLALTGDARYAWTHGIAGRFEDVVEGATDGAPPAVLARGLRISVTFRWLLPGADVVGFVGGTEARE